MHQVFSTCHPAELVEDINEHYHFVWKAILLLIMAIAILRILAGEQKHLNLASQYIDCGTSGGVYGLERGYCLMVGGANTAVSTCAPIFRALAPGIGAPGTDPTTRATSAEYGWLHCGPPGAGHFVKMVHNGVLSMELCRHMPKGFNILENANAGETTLKRAMLRLLRWRIREIISMILTF